MLFRRQRAVRSLRSAFPTLYQNLQLEDGSEWMAFARSSQCEQEIPHSVGAKISPFQQVYFTCLVDFTVLIVLYVLLSNIVLIDPTQY